MCKSDRHGHEFRCFIGGKTEHQTLVAGTLFLVKSFTCIDTLGDIGGLSVDAGNDGTGLLQPRYGCFEICDMILNGFQFALDRHTLSPLQPYTEGPACALQALLGGDYAPAIVTEAAHRMRNNFARAEGGTRFAACRDALAAWAFGLESLLPPAADPTTTGPIHGDWITRCLGHCAENLEAASSRLGEAAEELERVHRHLLNQQKKGGAA